MPSQLEALNRLLATAWHQSPFYRAKWQAADLSPGPLRALSDLERFPFATRTELERDQADHPPLGSHLSVPFGDCIRLHRSSGTTGVALFWADTDDSWRAVTRCSQALWEQTGVRRGDRVFFTMPFGGASGPWILRAGAEQLGCLCLTAGRASAAEQLQWIKRFKPTVLVGKPADLQKLTLAAEAAGINCATLGVRKAICGGAPGGHVAETRRELGRRWVAECFDRYGMTEAGPIAGECVAHPGGLHLLAEEFIAEIFPLDPARLSPEHHAGELVLTHLTRTACPVVRYRTGDLARVDTARRCRCGNPGPLLIGGVQRVKASAAVLNVCKR